jgi:hypothetical protein
LIMPYKDPARSRAWAEANRERKLASGRAYYAANKESILAKNIVYREAHREELALRQKAYYRANTEEQRALSRKRNRKNYWKDPERHSVLDAASKYGISEGEVRALRAREKCDVCGGKSRRMHIDHDHTTGKVRGFLCLKCNTSLHVLESGLYKKLQEYLLKHSA